MTSSVEITALHGLLYDSVVDRNERSLLDTVNEYANSYRKQIIGFIICLLDNACRDDFVWICYCLIKNNQNNLVSDTFTTAYELPNFE